MKLFFAILCFTLLAGCSSVLMKEPFPPSQLSEKERDQLTGIWKVDDAVLQVAFASNGVAQVAWAEWEEEAFQLKTFPLYITKQGKTLYLSLQIEEEPSASDPGGYAFFELKPADTQLIIWPSNLDFFKERVENGKLKGSVEKGKYSTSVMLNTPAKEILELITTNAAAFNYKEPTVLEKLN